MIEVPTKAGRFIEHRSTGRREYLKDMSVDRLKRLTVELPEAAGWVAEELAVRQTNQCLREASADHEFRMEVVAALMESGMARHVAMDVTNTEQKMLAQAKRLGLI